MAIYLVLYTYSADTETRLEGRANHRAWLQAQQDAGVLLGAGAYRDDGPAGAALVVRADSQQAVRDLLENDPYRALGVIDAVDIREWTPILGSWAE